MAREQRLVKRRLGRKCEVRVGTGERAVRNGLLRQWREGAGREATAQKRRRWRAVDAGSGDGDEKSNRRHRTVEVGLGWAQADRVGDDSVSGSKDQATEASRVFEWWQGREQTQGCCGRIEQQGIMGAWVRVNFVEPNAVRQAGVSVCESEQ